MTLRTLFRGASVALLFSVAPIAIGAPAAAAPPAATESPEPVQSIAVPAAAVFGGSSIYPTRGRYLLVDAASARLYMVEDGEVRDSMRVIVGKPTSQTPTLASKIYYATLNPYWNVTPDLVRSVDRRRRAQGGPAYLSSRGYQVLDSFDDAPSRSPARSTGRRSPPAARRSRFANCPGPPIRWGRSSSASPTMTASTSTTRRRRSCSRSDDRNLSHGCVRLEDAPRLARWLLGRDPGDFGSIPEEQVPLPQAVPIYITYLNEPANPLPLEPALTFASASR